MPLMTLEDYKKDFLEDVKASAEANQDGTTATFVSLASEKLYDAEVIVDFNPAFFEGTGKKNRKFRIDAYLFDEWDGTFTLIIADYNGSNEMKTLNKTGSQATFKRVTTFIEEVLDENLLERVELSNPIYDLIELMIRSNKFDKIRKFRILLLSDKLMSERISSFPNEMKGDITIEYHIWDISRFFRIFTSGSGKQILDIDFTEYMDNGIPCLNAYDASSDDYQCYLGVIPGKVLADVYDKYGSLLLEGNVRSFLSVRGKVNKAIRATIINEERASMFFSLNNGISVTATDLKVENINGISYIQHARDFQIVNGGQTTASLSNTRFKEKANLESIYVQMKLTHVKEELAQELIPLISKAANSQNKVSEADFFSNHPFHIRMEGFSRRIFAPSIDGNQFETKWFYERARGQYIQMQMKLSKAQQKKFKIQQPRNQLITKTDIAKVRSTWKRKPHIVSKGAQANFIDFANQISSVWASNNDSINELYYQESIALFILFKHTERLVSNQSWYESGYRANIVTYSIALLSYYLSEQYSKYSLNLQLIWNKQSVPEVITNELINITKLVFDSITDPARETINVTQWCKRENCWKKVKLLEYRLSPKIATILKSNIEARSVKILAKKDQKMLKGIEAQIFVVNLGAEYWADMLKWGSEKNKLSNEDKRFLSLAIRMSSSILPNPIQCRKLQELRNRLMMEGFKSK